MTSIGSNDDAERCVSCGKILQDGEAVFSEQGEGGHIHSRCASRDPESFVDGGGDTISALDDIPKSFAYRTTDGVK